MIGIYKITNKENGRVYIGESTSVENRWKQHIKDLEENRHHAVRLQYDYEKYGITKFEFSILEICEEEELSNREQYFINQYFNKCDGDIYNTKIKTNKTTKIKQKKDNQTIYIPKTIQYNTKTLFSERLLLMIVQHIQDKKSDYIEITLKQFEEATGKSGNSHYEYLKHSKEDLLKTTVNSIKLFTDINVAGNTISICVNNDVIGIIANKHNCFKTKLTIKGVSEFTNANTFKLYMFALKNKGENIRVEELKKHLGFSNKYSKYTDFKRKVLSTAIKDLLKNNISTTLQEYRTGRNITLIKFTFQ